MQAVILAAGRGTRMRELTKNTPKALLELSGVTLLEYKFRALPEEVDEIILVVGYLGGMIQRRFGGSYGDKNILYVEEEDPVGGSAHSLWKARPLLKDKFLVMNGDNIYAPEDMKACLKYDWAVLVQATERVGSGRVVVDEDGRVSDILENSRHGGEAGYENTGFYVLDTRIFDYPPVPKSEGSSELGLPQTIITAAKDIRIQAVPATFWIEIKSPEDLENASKIIENLED